MSTKEAKADWLQHVLATSVNETRTKLEEIFEKFNFFKEMDNKQQKKPKEAEFWLTSDVYHPNLVWINV